MAYNKSKYVEAAQKLLNQGKVVQAIAEYQQILKYEPRDQVTLMTIGELYIRQGETIQAIDYFERLAQLFVSDGFLTKAIAVYKRIAKLAPEEIRPLEKLADLYVQQGVMSEARPLFLQLAELHLKNNKQSEAVVLLKKLLAAEPDNLRIQVRLADLCLAMGQSGEALQAYISAAQRALARGEQAESEKLADKALQIESGNMDALIVKARAFSTAGNVTQATRILEKVPELEKGGEPAELLLDLYLKNDRWDDAISLAMKIFTADPKNFGATQKVTEGLLEAGQSDRAMTMVSRIRMPMLEAGEHEPLERLLTELSARMPGRVEPLEWLVDAFGRTSDSFRLPDALVNLGDALVKAGKLERAKEVFQQLVDREPDSDAAKRKLSDVERRLSGAAPEAPQADVVIDAEELQVEPPKAPAPKLRAQAEPAESAQDAPSSSAGKGEPELDEDTQKFIAQSLTDVDLFASYGLTQKAIGLLEAILRRAPTHTPTLEKLLDFVLGAGDDRRTAELAAQLEHIHASRGDARSSERFAELRRRFQRAAGMSDEDIAAAVAAALPPAVDTVPVEEVPVVVTSGPVPEVEVAPVAAEEMPEMEIVDESAEAETAEATPAGSSDSPEPPSEWASMLEETREPETKPAKKEAKSPAPPQHEEEEISMSELIEEEEAPAPVKEPKHEELVPNLEDASQEEFAVPVEEAATWEIPQEEIAPEPAAPQAHREQPRHAPEHTEMLLPGEEPTALPIPEHAEIASEKQEPALEEPAPPVHSNATPEPEFELEHDFELVLEHEEVVPPHEMMSQVPTTPAAKESKPAPQAEKPAAAFTADDFLQDLAKEIDGLGLEEITASAPQAKRPVEPAPAAPPPSETVKAQEKSPEHEPLKEVFDEFRAELGEMGAEDEDLETHYNLGIAFREMGLLEEAIGEFQKVAKANDRGKAFRYAMQCSTLLGLAFMEKGQPDIAAIWYERALKTPDIDSESKLALRYDLGVAQESAGDLDAALKSFSQVYAVNIDYRDVAERIASLQKPAR
jgi:pilus assembly protein FimV